MLSAWQTWVAALWIGTLIHLDWHLGRHGHDHRSFGLAYHWLLAIPAFLPAAWLACRTRPGSPFLAGLSSVLLGALLGQGLEPLGELLYFGRGAGPFLPPARWHVFVEFMAAGILVLLLAIVTLRRLWRAPAPR